MACAGGSMYSPTMSRTFSISSGSGDSLKVVLRCGWRPKAFQMRWTVMRLIPAATAIERVLQWVAPRGVASSVRTITSSTCASATWRGAPGRGSSCSPSSRSLTKRARHLPTICGVTRSLCATVWLSTPSAHLRIIRARRASGGALRERRAIDSSLSRSISLNTNSTLGRPLRILHLLEELDVGLGNLFTLFQGQDTRELRVERLSLIALKGRDYWCRILENRQLHDLAILQPKEMDLGDLEEDAGR